ncbi:monovalent cation:proton antiporter-2 (CPA2) family protein [Alteromonas sp. W364]|uniref:monovalent cation:proton antiporter-2 (CPA2) family protein n=1 Tax=Alteromonas sp. W364 TaxID=3075610 RepID=UPI0028889301|nr:monovalent cation:proton antiporter-2 (CPA2) family protein [Alteromonas sp. W364]MDT0627653.1 monovalent cation:proton antiporter-2 (CPA2) family protein [Alteromonas sp. W364]
MSLLGSVAIFLGATLVAVPLFKKLKLGAILGYLIAGVIIGPSALNLVSDPYTILHFAELGVVLLLFVIGLELEPATLWRMRNQILFSGGTQLLVSAAVIGFFSYAVIGVSVNGSIVIGLGLALSSTAFAIQLMNEQRILQTPPGQQGFSVLLMQDVAVIPILLVVAALAPVQTEVGPAWYISLGAVIAVLFVGRFLINPFLRIVARYGSSEVMTAAALFIVLVTALAMDKVGLSMGMGAFIAGILLADSTFKHQLETEIEPFKGLLLGLFFIAIGMNLDLQLLINEPVFIISMSMLLVVVKAAIIFVILRASKQSGKDAMRVALMLSQGGEFAFVVMTLALSNAVLDASIAGQVNLIVGLSMALTSPIVIIYSLFFNTRHCPAVYDSFSDNSEPKVIIAGFGRFGQITGRILAANGIPFTAMDKDAEHIEFVRQFGNKVYFGDATRLDLLKKSGIEEARVLLVAIDNAEEITELVKLVQHEFPKVKVIARARNRMHAIDLSKLGVSYFIREMFDSALSASKEVLKAYGYTEGQAENMAALFSEHDKKMLDKVVQENLGLPEMIKSTEQGRAELQQLFEEDKQ